MMKKYFLRKKQTFNLMMATFYVIAFLSIPNGKLYAQQKDFKIDTVEMEVFVSAYTANDLQDPDLTAVDQKFIIEPKSKGFNIRKSLNKNYRPDFNGVFIINDRQLVEYGVVMKKARGFKTTRDPLKTDRIKKFKPVPQGVQGAKYFYGLEVKARWLKYEIKNFDPIERSQQKLYKQNTGQHNGTFNFYVIDKVKRSRTIYE